MLPVMLVKLNFTASVDLLKGRAVWVLISLGVGWKVFRAETVRAMVCAGVFQNVSCRWVFVPMTCLLLCFRMAEAQNTLCLDTAIPPSNRKDLVNQASGESYPIGVWVNDWAAGHLTATAVQIVIQEILGFHAELKGPGPLALDGFFALTGCITPTNSSDRGCGPATTYTHINIEAWTAAYSGTWDEMQVKYPQMAPKNLGNMGYYGVSSMYVASAVQQRAYDVDGINLDFYRDYNTSRQSPGKHFAGPSELDASKLLPCTDTALMLNEVMTNYVDLTDDWGGVVTSASGELTGKCFDTYFWYAPGCRDRPSICLTWFTGGSGWGMFEMLVKATTYNMPLATAVASSFSNYALLPQSHDMMLFWWVPDPTFLRLAPRKITFPEHDPDEWAKGNRRTAARDVSIDKQVSRDLSDLAPEVGELISQLSMSLSMVNAMMMDQLNTEDSNRDVACRWLRANEASWSAWVPEKGKCFSQFGMYDEQRGEFLTKREGSTISCQACPSGSYSSRLEDDQGVTFICKACGSGSFQTSGASVSCNPCPSGSYQNETGSLSCNRCPVGQYQNQEGSSNCMTCPAGTTTLLLGSVSVLDCGCEPGTINLGDNDTFNCVPCGKGLDCPFASTLKDLKSGQSSRGFQLVPVVRSGYYSAIEEPLELLQCRPQSFCPGGSPGTCANGLVGTACAVCPEGQSRASGACADCGAITYAWLLALPGAMAVLPIFYYLNTMEVRAQASPLKTGAMVSGIAVSSLQNLAVIGLMSAKWSGTFETTSSKLQVFILDLDGLSGSCVTGNAPEMRYLMSVAIFPIVLLGLALCHAISCLIAKQVKSIRPWKWPLTVNASGLALQLCYGAMAAVAFKPFMCFEHPNGASSLISYPNLFCGERGHVLMQAVGISFMTMFVAGFFVLCVYVAWELPHWCATNRTQRVQCFRFFLSNFRFDAHWFMVFVLLRGFGFALSLAVGTNMPPLQTALATLVLTIYLLAQALMLPWKVPLINVTDMLVNAAFLVLVNKASIQVDADMESQFAEQISVFILLFILLIILLALAMSGVALLLKLAGVDWAPVLTLGTSDGAKIAKALKACADQLMEVEDSELASKIAGSNPYDVKILVSSIDLMSEILGSSTLLSMTSSRQRVNATVVNHRLTVNVASVGDVKMKTEDFDATASLDDSMSGLQTAAPTEDANACEATSPDCYFLPQPAEETDEMNLRTIVSMEV